MNTNTAKILIVVVALLTSCATQAPEPVTITEVEYKPITLDISDSVEVLFDTRPELAPTFNLNENSPAVEQAVLCALLYKSWGESWQAYAMRLEDYILVLQKTLNDPNSIIENAEPT